MFEEVSEFVGLVELLIFVCEICYVIEIVIVCVGVDVDEVYL